MTQGVQHHDEVSGEAVGAFSEGVLARNSSSFRWASHFLPTGDREDATLLYAVCRGIDDVADETEDVARARQQLQRFRAELTGQLAPRPLLREFLRMAHRRKMDLAYVLELIRGVESDLGPVRIETDTELLRYCYRVAGTVGLMMCSVLGVEARRAWPHAIDLGMAMQLTNICRDVGEDAERDRVYLPASRLDEVGVSQAQILKGEFDARRLAGVVEDLLELADVYYASGDEGMWAIPARARTAILMASRIYRSIGVRLRRNGCDVRHVDRGPSLLSLAYWSWAAFGTWCIVTSPTHRPAEHRQVLHRALRGLPGIDS